MKGLRVGRVLCLLAALVLVAACGCNAFTPQRQRMRAYAVMTDLDRAVDDIDWMLGTYRPTRMYDESVR